MDTIPVSPTDPATNAGFDYVGSQTCSVKVGHFSYGTIKFIAQRDPGFEDYVHSWPVQIKYVDTRLNSLRVTTSSKKVFPYRDGYRDNTTIKLTVSGVNSSGVKVPFSAKVALNGKTILKKSSGAKAKSLTFEVKVNPKNYVTNKIRVTGTGSTLETRAKTVLVDVALTGINKASVLVSQAAVFPFRDGFQDSARITVSASTTTSPKQLKTKGTLVVKNTVGKVVKSWNIKHSGTSSFVWNGRVNGRIVPGKYFIALKVAGPQGKTITSGTQIKVSDQEAGWTAVATDKREWSISEGDVKSVTAKYNKITGEASLLVHYWRSSYDFGEVNIGWGKTCNSDINELTASTDIYAVGVLDGYVSDHKFGKWGTRVSVDVYDNKTVEYTIYGDHIKNRNFACASISTWWAADTYHIDWDCDCVTRIYNEDAVSVKRK
ncbi:MAG: hypothetical protein NTW81_07155 [Actinobacteria bacterium]|nr:hypothetical protein [Actinomycetota bacterium]